MDKTTTSSLGFNKRRAEGGDKRDKHKTFQSKVQKLNQVNTISYVQILGTGMDTQDTSPSVLLFFDKQRFIFNVGEGFQRYCTEHKIKLSKIDHIFHSRVSSETVGGLPGLLLTLAGMGENGMSVKIWGPSDLKTLINAMLSFIPNDVVHTTYFGPAPMGKFTDPIDLINDEVVKISAILLKLSCPIVSEQHKELSRPLGPLLPHLDSPKRNGGPVPKQGDISVIYVCELPEIKGKFDKAKADALGLKPGPKYRELQLGNSVMSDDKNVMVSATQAKLKREAGLPKIYLKRIFQNNIYPNDVLGPSTPGPIVLLVDCPTLYHLQELLSIQSLTRYYSDSEEQHLNRDKKVDCIIHLSPSSVTTTPTYQNWMKRFGKAQHIMAGYQIKNVGNPILRASARIAARLNYLCPQFFPASGFRSSEDLNNIVTDSDCSNEGTVPMLCESIPAENLLKFHLRPNQQRGLNRSEVPALLSQKEIINELLSEIPEIIDYKEQVSQLWVDDFNDNKRALKQENLDDNEYECPIPSCLENITKEDMEIVLLGTGSSQPSKHRNVSSIYLNLFSKGGLLLDCGEATLAQLIKRYSDTGANKAVRSLKCIWISHIHADHHAGLSSILRRRSNLLKGVLHEPLLIIGPCQLKIYLDASEDLNTHFLDCRHTTEASLSAFESAFEPSENWVDSAEHFKSLNKLKNVVKEAGLEGIVSVPVVHCPQAFGVVVKAAERRNIIGETVPGWKLVYSGDTRPCQQLINAARGATVLIHEATFENGMVEEAIAKNHSTTKEAIEVGDSAGAYRIILTHFSQRYPKIPVFDDTHIMHKTCIAFDLMSINIADLPLLPKVLPYLKLLFKNEMVADETIL